MGEDVPAIAVALGMIALTGPDSQRIDVAPSAIVSLREPRGPEHFAPGVRCLLHMSDGRVVTVVETCDTVRERLNEAGEE
jgi:hypothetical protein